MTNAGMPLSHLPYFERLSHLEEGSPTFRAMSAGLVTLRLVDAWVMEGPHVAAPDAWGMRAVREAIEAMDHGSTSRALLLKVLEAMDPSGSLASVRFVTPRLMAYARALQLDGEWALAADVYRTVLAHAHPLNDADSVINANLMIAACSRTLARWDDAWEAYGSAGEVAALTGDIMSMLKARIGEANVLTDRGNLPEAESILDQTILDAEQLGMTELRALALQDRAHTAHRRGDYDAAIAMQYLALQDVRTDNSRDRVLADLAASFFEIGLHTAARDANLVLAATAQEQFTRWQATINLMELAGADHFEPVFEQYRRELSTAALPPVLSAWYFFYSGQGFRMFDRPEQARVALERALEIAHQHQLNQVAFHAEQALGDLKDGIAIEGAAPAATTPMVEEAAAGVRKIRELAGIKV
jgi:tetratricopeptide (TPR) repeat protein